MTDVTYITGNQHKARLLAEHLGVPIKHHSVDLDEIQSLDLKTVVEHKVRQAFLEINSPVLVEDTSLEFHAFGRLPGCFIRFFLEEMPLETICRMLDGMDRTATGRVMFGYFDGTNTKFFESSLRGTIADHPSGDGGFGWDKIFIPEGSTVTRACLDEAAYNMSYMQLKPVKAVHEFLTTKAKRTDNI